ncbi:MAG: molybdopterin-dependent oxidoreductase, partial [Thermoflexibacter sp.]|nr:molybdopterin-dependent oxidoreductase [Thermoflexibacter sp.]
MNTIKTTYNRRSFLKVSALSGGGFLLGFSMLAGMKTAEAQAGENALREIFDLNSYIKITDKGEVTIFCPNPEFGQNVRTSMPMIVAEELDVDWKKVIVEQAPHNNQLYGRQFTGGSQSIRQGWKALRTAGASARQMLREAAAQAWQVPVDEITTEAGMLSHKASGKTASYGTFASAAAKIPVPKEVKLKEVKAFNLIGKGQKNVDGLKIVTGKPLFTMDYKVEGMLIAMIVHPPAFGLKLKSFDASSVNKMAGIKDVFSIKVHNDGYEKIMFDTRTFNEMVVIVGNSTWEVMNAKKKLVATWEPISETVEKEIIRGTVQETKVPAGLENTETHYAKMKEASLKTAEVLRKDGNPEEAFAKASQFIERTYTAPFLAHNCMEPTACFAHVIEDKAFLAAPIQGPEFIEQTISARIGIPKEKIDIELLRMGGGFGRRAYGHYMVEAAVISQKVKAPIKLIYSREDDMTYGIYRPTYTATYRAALDANK